VEQFKFIKGKLRVRCSVCREGIDAHGLKIQGRGYLKFLSKFLGGMQGFQEKMPVGSPYFGVYWIFINKCFEICLGGTIFTLPPLKTCVHLCVKGPSSFSPILVLGKMCSSPEESRVIARMDFAQAPNCQKGKKVLFDLVIGYKKIKYYCRVLFNFLLGFPTEVTFFQGLWLS